MRVSYSVRSAVQLVEQLAEQHQVEVHIEPSIPDDACIQDRRGDTVRLVRNLLENAIRFSPPGGRVIVTGGGGDDRSVRLTIADSGPGIDPAERDEIFKPFFRGNGVSGQGAGLGLGIAREIARSHGGDVTLDPTSSVGARFVVVLPLAPQL